MNENNEKDSISQMQIATFGGGCFWCLEATFSRLKGVSLVEPGYAGGSVIDPDYDAVCSGTTGHAEVVRIHFDESVISYRQILEVFFALHDPTTPDRQGNDVGSQYRSVIFWHAPEQRQIAEDLIRELEAGRTWPAPVVTQRLPAPAFFPAEDYHRGYFESHPGQPYCQYVVAPKVDKLRRKFGPWLTE